MGEGRHEEDGGGGEKGLEDASVPVVSPQLAKLSVYGNRKKVKFSLIVEIMNGQEMVSILSKREVISHGCKFVQVMVSGIFFARIYFWQNGRISPKANHTYLESYDTQLSFGLSGNHFNASIEASEFCWQIRSFWTGFFP